jgi:nucleotide-binding universal stress UspA family protein
MAESQNVVVGVDGSDAAIAAAVWAVPEAVSRDIPLHLVHAIDPRSLPCDDPDQTSRRVAHAESILQKAMCAVQATDSRVKVEVEVVHGRPIPILVRAAHSATILCVGSVGFKRFGNGHLGSTTAAVIDAGLSAVAVVRADGAVRNGSCGAIAVEMIASQLNAALFKTAIAEARARGAAVRVVTCWKTGSDESKLRGARISNLDYQARAHLYRALAQWKRRYPELIIQAITTHTGMADYVAGTDGRSVQLVIVPPGERGETGYPGGVIVRAALQNSGCSVLIAKP